MSVNINNKQCTIVFITLVDYASYKNKDNHCKLTDVNLKRKFIYYLLKTDDELMHCATFQK